MLLMAAPAAAQIVINEVSASNYSNFADNFGEYEDWVELYNTSGALVDVSGWHVSDDPSDLLKWTFGAGTTIAANGRLMVFASGRDQSAGPIQHTNFKLSQTAQEFVILADAGGNAIDQYQLNQRTQRNHSRGRTTDGAATWSLFTTPTPNAPNAGASPDYEAKPQITPQAGFFGGAQNITITSPGGAQIRYTTDGSEPTAASALYAGPIAVNATTVVRAACFSTTPGVPRSFIETNSYFIGVTHTVPTLSIAGDQVDDLLNGNGGLEPIGSFEYFGEDQLLRDEAVGDFNEHGNDSWAYDQRGFDYITRDQFGYNDGIHYPVFRTKNRDDYQRLIIKAAANDNYPFAPGQGAHIRDAYVHALSQVGHLKLDERSYEPCVLYVNGQYWGVYEIREKVDDADFTREYYQQDENNLYFLKTWGGTWSEFGGAAAKNDWDQLRAFIMANNMGDPNNFATVDAQYNWQSLIDYFCLNSYTVCTDWLNWNTAWWHGLDPAGDGRRWRYALWDNDATFGHYINYTGVPDDSPAADPCNAENLPNPGGQGHTEVLTKLITENPTVHDYYVNRYIDLGNTVFSCDHMLPFLDSLIALITPEMPGQIARWGGTMAEWENNVQIMRDFISARCVQIQQGLVDCYNVDGPYEVVFKVDPPMSGDIRINSIVPGGYPFQGTYYGGINTTLEGLPAAGWAFDHWELLHHAVSPSTSDSLVTMQFTGSDTIIAHFIPPITHTVMLDVDPPNSGGIAFDGTFYSTFPTWVNVPENVQIPMSVSPAQYYDFVGWSIKNGYPSPADTTLTDLTVTFWTSDTIVAHLKPQDHAYFVPNSFTPNGDGINDSWQPWGNVIDLEKFDIKVFDRWGQLMFSSQDPNEPWDGTLGGQPMPEGVYVYKAHVVEGITKERHEFFGHLSLVR